MIASYNGDGCNAIAQVGNINDEMWRRNNSMTYMSFMQIQEATYLGPDSGHKHSIHKGKKYSWYSCDYQVTQRGSLMENKKSFYPIESINPQATL